MNPKLAKGLRVKPFLEPTRSIFTGGLRREAMTWGLDDRNHCLPADHAS